MSNHPLAPRPAVAGETRLQCRRGGTSPEDRDWLRARAEEIETYLYRGACDIVRIGLALEAVRKRLGHGRYLAWVEAELPISAPTAQRYRQVARVFGGFLSVQFEQFDPSALYVLAAAKGVPPGARAHAVQLVGEGKRVTHALALEILDAHRPLSEKDAVRELRRQKKAAERVERCRGRRPGGEYCTNTFVSTGERFCPECLRAQEERESAASVQREKAKKWDMLVGLLARCRALRVERTDDDEYDESLYSVTAHFADDEPLHSAHPNPFVALAAVSAERGEGGVRVEPMKKCSNPDCAAPGGMRPYGCFKASVTNPDGFDTRCRQCVHRQRGYVGGRRVTPPPPGGAQAA